MAGKKKRRKKKKKQKLTKEQRTERKLHRRFKIDINTMFKNCGFEQIATRHEEIEFQGRKSDIDNLFLYKNILVASEDTTLASENIKDHLTGKANFYEHCRKDEDAFVQCLTKKFPEIKSKLSEEYSVGDIKIFFLYCSLNNIEHKYIARFPDIKFLIYPSIKYFVALNKVIQFSARFELLKFLGVDLQDLSTSGVEDIKKYDAFVLPETPSGFPDGYKLITFYIDPETLIQMSFVLRKDSWQDQEGLYQRMFIKSKIKSMRKYLADEDRVYINNAIVSLPSHIWFTNEAGEKIPFGQVKKTQNVKVNIPLKFNSIGIIDGQHRIFSYHEGLDSYEKNIRIKRKKQQLLLTGVIFPKEDKESERVKFEAKLFLEINDKQNRAKSDLKQAIETIVSPFTAVAIGKSVISYMANNGVLTGRLEDHYFGGGQIKTASIVSYALAHIVVASETPPEHGFFRRWKADAKYEKWKKKNMTLRKEYVEYCGKQTNLFISAFADKIKKEGLWTHERKISRALTTTTINGLIYCLRLLIANNKLGTFEDYRKGFEKLTLSFKPNHFAYKSSHWKSLGDRIYLECFQEGADKFKVDPKALDV